ncbi:HEAT repeat domain-containing protein [Haloplanus rallus]|jgi:HEAT repeat protein|uniref:HEAT repeat domain-containing protein n=1 Tax=Haloplanus rallus TaxID=1816183 RepID=A0A6B9FDK2_9EURY|nr:HEAT repeat domain-containing protein [Haloplanus rallus]QGX94580.1 HEAT repeat domain-containing protein [Haloplanus rallus]
MVEDRSEADTAFLYELARESNTTELVAYLRRGSRPVVRRRAAEMLGDFAEETTRNDGDTQEVIRALIQAVREDDDRSVRARAIDALYRHGPDTLERLVHEMGEFDIEPEEGTRSDTAAERATARLLEEWLDADYPEFRMVAATALGRMGGERSLSALVAATTDPSPRVRARAVQSCGWIGDERCVGALRNRLDDDRRRVREEAVRALGAIGSEAALRSLAPVVQADEESLRRAAIEELGQFATLEPVDVLLRALVDDTAPVQRAALLSLVQLFVDAPAERRQEVREAVADRLSNADTLTVVPHVIDMLDESRRTDVRHNAAWLLGRVADADDPDADRRDAVYDCLIAALGDPDDRTARLAASSLAELESEKLERRLQILVHDEDVPSDVAERAEAVLDEIGGSLSGEVVTNAVDYTYVRDPSDYTANHDDADREP